MILILTLGVFGILNTEMGIVGILPMIAEQYNVSIATAGWLVSGFCAGGGSCRTDDAAALFQDESKGINAGSGRHFYDSNIISAFAPNFFQLLIARVIPAAFHPAYVSMALTEAGKAVKPEESARAVAKVFYWSFRGNGTGGSGYQPDRRPDFFYGCNAVFCSD